MRQFYCKRIAEGARAKTLRQKDWILTELWKANWLHRRSNLRMLHKYDIEAFNENLSGKGTEA